MHGKTRTVAAAGLVVLGVAASAAAVREGLWGAPRSGPAVEAARLAQAKLKTAFDNEKKSLQTAVLAAAAVEPLRAALSNDIDEPTLRDLFKSEDWWAPFRQDFAGVRLILDGRTIDIGDVTITEDATALIAAARQGEATSGMLQGKVGPVAVGAAQLAVSHRAQAPVLMLARPFGDATIARLAADSQLGIAMFDGTASVSSAGPSELRAALSSLGEQKRDTAVASDQRWGAARLSISPHLSLWAASALPPGVSPGLAPRKPLGALAAVSLVGAVALVLTGRRRKPSALPAVPQTVEKEEHTLPFGTPFRKAAAAAGHPVDPAVPRTIETAHEPRSAPIPAPGPGPLQPGKTFGRYRLFEKVGEGGMSEIYTAATHGAAGFTRTFVLKRLRPEIAHEKEAVTQFIDEARMQASLVHSNIVPVFDFGKMGTEYFMAMEYINGRNLCEITLQCAQATRFALNPGLVAYFASETLQALGYAHSKRDRSGRPLGIVHRDVSANNILVSAAGEVKLFDFGIAKANKRLTQTQAGMLKGNAIFMSPEQARGQPVDARSDLFALGLVMYFCLTSTYLYTGANELDVLFRAACGLSDEDWQKVQKLPHPAPQILKRALAADPEQRFRSAEEFAEALAPFVGGMKAEAAALMETLFGEDIRRADARYGGNVEEVTDPPSRPVSISSGR